MNDKQKSFLCALDSLMKDFGVSEIGTFAGNVKFISNGETLMFFRYRDGRFDTVQTGSPSFTCPD